MIEVVTMIDVFENIISKITKILSIPIIPLRAC